MDAERWLRVELSRIDRGEWIDPDLGRITWAEYSALLLAARNHLAPRTIETNRLCNQRAEPFIRHIELRRITPDHIRQLQAQLASAGYAPETIVKTMRWVRLTLNQAVSDRRIPSSPAQGIRLPNPRRSEMRILTPDHVLEIAEALPERYQSLPIVAAYTGLRWGELAGLRVTDIDMLRRRLTVTNALIEASGQPPQLGPPKTTASERTITLPNVAIDEIAAHLQANPAVDGMVWTTRKGAYLRRGSFGRIWRQAIQLTVGSPCRIHDLRHSHAAWLIAAGEHPKAIQSRLGHSSIQVTIDRYGHLMDGLDSQTAERLDAIAGSSRGPGVAQGAAPVDHVSPKNDGNPRSARVSGLQPRPGSNWRYRLERPAS